MEKLYGTFNFSGLILTYSEVQLMHFFTFLLTFRFVYQSVLLKCHYFTLYIQIKTKMLCTSLGKNSKGLVYSSKELWDVPPKILILHLRKWMLGGYFSVLLFLAKVG